MSTKAPILLRTAAILMFLHFAGHTIGMTRGPSHGSEEVAVIQSMQAHQFDMMGSSRTYWDFFLGFGYDASINMLLEAVLLWLLARLATRDPASARPFIAVFLLAWIPSALLYLRYFFIAPTAFAFLMIAVLGAAWATARPYAA
jgi:hypothetical protein